VEFSTALQFSLKELGGLVQKKFRILTKERGGGGKGGGAYTKDYSEGG
jgi:hypothetical protein